MEQVVNVKVWCFLCSVRMCLTQPAVGSHASANAPDVIGFNSSVSYNCSLGYIRETGDVLRTCDEEIGCGLNATLSGSDLMCRGMIDWLKLNMTINYLLPLFGNKPQKVI